MTRHLAHQPRTMEGSMAHRLALVRQRLVFLLVLFFAGFAVLGLRTLSLATGGTGGGRATASAAVPDVTASTTAMTEPLAERAPIVDRAGRLLAVNLPVRSLYADPRRLRDDPARVARRLARILEDVPEGLIRSRLESGRRFVWIKRHLTPDEVWRVNALGIAGLAFRREERRIYPQGRLAAHLVGFVDADGRGLMGVERAFDDRLRRPAGGGGALRLALDLRVQQALRDELRRAMAHFSALGAAGVVMDVDSGELLALVSLPDFDPDHAADAPARARFNRVTQGVYELGSTFKTFTLAAALDAGVVRLDSRYDARAPIRVAGGYTIHDDHPKSRVLSVPEAYVYSSNIAFAKMALDLGLERQRAFFARLGFFRPPAVELPERGRPLHPEPWREVTAMTAAFGHGIAVTPLQLAAATAAMVNGGVLHPATVLLHEGREAPAGEPVIDPATSARLRALMRLVVVRGTGAKAEAAGYRVAGKTGTAEKAIGGRYRRDALLTSFVGVFPADGPRYLVLALLDEPKGRADTFGFASAGWTAAPVVSRVVERIAPMLGIPPAEPREDPLFRRAALMIAEEGKE